MFCHFGQTHILCYLAVDHLDAVEVVHQLPEVHLIAHRLVSQCLAVALGLVHRLPHPATQFAQHSECKEAHNEASLHRRLRVRLNRIHAAVAPARLEALLDVVTVVIGLNGLLGVAFHRARTGKEAEVPGCLVEFVVITLKAAAAGLSLWGLVVVEQGVVEKRLPVLLLPSGARFLFIFKLFELGKELHIGQVRLLFVTENMHPHGVFLSFAEIQFLLDRFAPNRTAAQSASHVLHVWHGALNGIPDPAHAGLGSDQHFVVAVDAAFNVFKREVPAIEHRSAPSAFVNQVDTAEQVDDRAHVGDVAGEQAEHHRQAAALTEENAQADLPRIAAVLGFAVLTVGDFARLCRNVRRVVGVDLILGHSGQTCTEKRLLPALAGSKRLEKLGGFLAVDGVRKRKRVVGRPGLEQVGGIVRGGQPVAGNPNFSANIRW